MAPLLAGDNKKKSDSEKSKNQWLVHFSYTGCVYVYCISCLMIKSLDLYPPLTKAILKKGYNLLTPIQRKVIPELLIDRDLVAMARTGSGKTAAFVIPLIHKLKCHSVKVT
jgi:superfamily II DNA/RNA helicase